MGLASKLAAAQGGAGGGGAPQSYGAPPQQQQQYGGAPQGGYAGVGAGQGQPPSVPGRYVPPSPLYTRSSFSSPSYRGRTCSNKKTAPLVDNTPPHPALPQASHFPKHSRTANNPNQSAITANNPPPNPRDNTANNPKVKDSMANNNKDNKGNMASNPSKGNTANKDKDNNSTASRRLMGSLPNSSSSSMVRRLLKAEVDRLGMLGSC